MRISVLLPSRGRPVSLVRSIGSLVTNSSDPHRVQVLVGWDDDDPDTATAARASTALDIITVRFPERFGYYQLHRYVNALAARASGDWLLLWNDDATLVTSGWDSVIDSHDHTTPLVLSLSSTGFGHRLCCFPATSRTLYQRLGHMSLSPHIDTWLQDIGRATGCIRDIPVHVHHDRADLTGGHNDQTRAEALAGYGRNEFYDEATQALLRADIDKVRA